MILYFHPSAVTQAVRAIELLGNSRSVFMTRILGGILILIGTSAVAMASTVPEIDAGSGVTALALLSGGLLVLRTRRGR